MGTTPLRIGILGTGNIAARALLAPAQQVPEVAVVAVGSREVERARSYAAAQALARATSYEGLLADPDVDIVYITLPPSAHAEWSIRALAAGKHVLCEKPLTSNEREAHDVATAVQRSGRVYMEAFHYPYHPFAKRVRDLIDTQVLGGILGAEAHFQIPGKYIAAGNIRRQYTLGGGALMDAGCYALNALRGFLGEPERVLMARAQLQEGDPFVDVDMRATLVFPGGRTGTLHASFLAQDAPDVAVVVEGERGRLEIQSLYVPQWGGTLRLTWDDRVYDERADPTPSYVFQLRELVRCIRQGAPVLTSAENGALNMRAIDAIYRAAGLPLRGG
ncbi:MAG: Gfo/Idh/MocA family oxidoreductase [Gammaproteobacteria bacterium]|nr:Gfo/Idh/MocA family oxidoreductase [Gammaproteobacteria bacterium]